MKLRIRDNSIRLRLSQTEVDTMRTDGIVGGKLSFPGGASLGYCLEGTPACVDAAAQFSDGELLVRLPEATVVQWADSDEVSIEATQTLDDGSSLKILIEKDFACIAPREGEDESDMYPHPQEGEANC
jgi:hypothetical protein